MILLENVTKIFPGHEKPAVDNLSLEVKEGEICVFVGPSGCGKTTTMKMINRLYEITEGKISVNGEDINKVDVNTLRRNIGYVIQEIGLFPHMTIEENVATVPRELKWPRDKTQKRVYELLKLVGLEPTEYAKRRPSALSGGQRQRVGVARAMASDPPVLLMDEPFGAVDPITRGRLQNEFLRLQEQMKKTIVFVTHDIDEAIKMGDKIAVMREGHLVQYSTPDELLSTPKNEFVASLVGRNRSIKRLHLIHAESVVKPELPLIKLKDNLSIIRERIKDSPLEVAAVVDDKDRLLGVVSQSDIKDLEEENITASQIYSEINNYCTDDATLNDVLSIMLNYGEGYVVVTGDDEKVQGVITLGDIMGVVKDESNSAA
ncbi:MAG: ATP-binding cassette domain-containing protein [Candidatus Syntrophonatronum acetioxidans]|uniref:Quaternary amine transport ATP-binding protein n=1 Tax=Candidatus Syntrophonatronum acetioxidans TaxID=1795816 RepID=A0A424YET4_9FIRM|nr:MAG: ATP-binding cassette domain-containing protein [Candidatus Syntrophonatronum acetioxidans]